MGRPERGFAGAAFSPSAAAAGASPAFARRFASFAARSSLRSRSSSRDAARTRRGSILFFSRNWVNLLDMSGVPVVTAPSDAAVLRGARTIARLPGSVQAGWGRV